MKKISDLIRDFETNCNPQDIKVKHGDNDFEVYPWIKPFIFSRLQTGEKPKSRDINMWFQFKQIFSGWHFFFVKYKTVIFSNSLERRDLDDGVYDKLFHYISMQKSLHPSLTIEAKFPSNYFPSNKYKNPICVSRSFLFLKELVYRKIFLRNISILNDQYLKSFILENDINVNINYAIRKNIAQYKVMYKFFKKRPDIKHVFLTVSYTNFGLIKACKELGIQVIEIQHGVINTEHYGYNYFYTPQKCQYPDFLLTLGNADCEFFKNSPLSKFLTPVSIGSFIIEYYLQKSSKTRASEKTRVVISLQDCETGVESVKDFIRLAELNPMVDFYFKRRRLSIDFYTNQFCFPDNAHFDETKNIYDLMVFCDFHLTAYSSCAIEALSLGTPNILYNINDKANQYYSEKLPKGIYNNYCDNVEMMNGSLQDLVKLKFQKDAIRDSNNKNIRANYKDNVNSFLKNHISNEG